MMMSTELYLYKAENHKKVTDNLKEGGVPPEIVAQLIALPEHHYIHLDKRTGKATRGVSTQIVKTVQNGVDRKRPPAR